MSKEHDFLGYVEKIALTFGLIGLGSLCLGIAAVVIAIIVSAFMGGMC